MATRPSSGTDQPPTAALATRYEAMLAAIPDIIAEVDLHRVYTWLNQAGLDFFGKDALGKEASFFFEGDQPTYDIVSPLFEGSRDTVYLESWQRRKDGEKRLLAWWCGTLKNEQGEVVGALSTARDITEHYRTEQALRDSEQKIKALVDNAAQGILSVSRDGNILLANPMVETLFGYQPGELLGETVEKLLPDVLRSAHARERDGYFENPRSRPMGRGLNLAGRRKDGEEFPIEVSLSHVRTAEGPMAVAFISDITKRVQAERERLKLEHRLEHATKMEAVGGLAGGIAHDFNNLLTALSGFAEIVLDHVDESHPLHRGAQETFKTCQRSSSLVRRLLAVSRRQVLQPTVLDLNAKIREIESIVRGTLGEDVDLIVRLTPDLGRVRADDSQIDQVILNLVVNARDAMPEGGRLTIETKNLDPDQMSPAGGSTPVGPQVMLVVRDEGEGMDKATMAHIFEPYFTTKAKGKGTGLGLATVYGIVKQTGGNIWADSEPGRGATFTVTLPRVETTPRAETAKNEPGGGKTGSETVLVVEDENTVRLVAVSTLKDAGYRVLEASNGREAIRLAEEADEPIDLVLSDVVMPKMNGPELYRRLTASFPLIKGLFMSGHADDALMQRGMMAEEMMFLEKPFTRDSLTRKVREVLDGEATG